MKEIIKEFREQFDHIVPSQWGFIVGKKGSSFDNCACDLSYLQDCVQSLLEEKIKLPVVLPVKSLELMYKTPDMDSFIQGYSECLEAVKKLNNIKWKSKI